MSAPSNLPTITFVRSGAFSGSSLRLQEALKQQTDVRDVDLMPLARQPSLLQYRAAAQVEALASGARSRWRFTGSWSFGTSRWMRHNVPHGRNHEILFVQTIHAPPLDVPYYVYTDRVGSEGAATGGIHRTRASQSWRRREADFLRNAQHIFVMGPSTRAALEVDYGISPDRVSVVGAGPNTDVVERDPVDALRRLLFVGTQWELKGGDQIVEAFASVKESHENLELWLVGSAPRVLPKGVTSLGKIPHSAMADVYRQCDAFIVVPFQEAFGIALLEALQAGLPAIVSDVGNQQHLLGGAGLVVPPGDTVRLREAIMTLARDYPLFQSQAFVRGRELRQTMTWERVAASIIAQMTGHSSESGAGNRR